MNKTETQFVERRAELLKGKHVSIHSEDFILRFHICAGETDVIISNYFLEGKSNLGRALEETIDQNGVEAICYATLETNNFRESMDVLEEEVKKYGLENHSDPNWVWDLAEQEEKGFIPTSKKLCFAFAKSLGFVNLTKKNNPGVSVADKDGVVFNGQVVDAVLCFADPDDEAVTLEVYVNNDNIQNENHGCVGQWNGEKAKVVIQNISHLDKVIGEILKCENHAFLEPMIDKHFEALGADSIGY